MAAIAKEALPIERFEMDITEGPEADGGSSPISWS